MKSQVIKHFTLHFQNLRIQEDISSGSSMAICIYVQQSLTPGETNTSAFWYVLSVMIQNSSTLGAQNSSYFLQKESLWYFQLHGNHRHHGMSKNNHNAESYVCNYSLNYLQNKMPQQLGKPHASIGYILLSTGQVQIFSTLNIKTHEAISMLVIPRSCSFCISIQFWERNWSIRYTVR